ncbi:hypothetical protein NPIL_627311 [Nephila pilipes]|uniref:Uncharacterized protein n=1 Tax=Nephila pilipes TaxID=299642 RepID=A0A8X6N5N6_NEPPI|nr:hypothetical protein NPIL_627311 [Nephila pilipes]
MIWRIDIQLVLKVMKFGARIIPERLIAFSCGITHPRGENKRKQVAEESVRVRPQRRRMHSGEKLADACPSGAPDTSLFGEQRMFVVT